MRPRLSQKKKKKLDIAALALIISFIYAGPRSAVGKAPDSYVRGPGFDTRSGHILSFLLPLIQEGQLSVTGESTVKGHNCSPPKKKIGRLGLHTVFVFTQCCSYTENQ